MANLMIPEIGQYALILALLFSLLQVVVPAVGVFKQSAVLQWYAKPLCWGQFAAVTLGFVVLMGCFLQDDFSVAYIANHSNSLLPWYYKVSAVWGGHEGSLLLWIFMLSGWSLAVSLKAKALPLDMLARVLSVMGIVGLGFLLFLLWTSNPFDRVLPSIPQDGADLNPLLQDFGLIVHPPMLYMGYVGFSVAFAFAIAALWSGRLDAAWAKWSRPWTNLAWAFLTLGIALGSWWAYYELGWGGWWFWDPVENASLLPWLMGTALIHSLAVTEKRSLFKSWTLLLAIFAFSLSLLGTFLVRSGVLTSVHAFASDPERGVFILMLLALCIGGSLILYAFRAPTVRNSASFSMNSRESFLLANNFLLLIATFIVLLGTLAPLVVDALKMGKISVGPPYFNIMFVPLAIGLILLMGIGGLSYWKKTPLKVFELKVWLTLVLTAVLGLAFPWMYGDHFNVWVALGVWVASWLISVCVIDLWNKSSHSSGRWTGFKGLGRSYKGMILAHIGVAVTALGVTLVSNYALEKDVRMAPGDSMDIGGYRVEFEGVSEFQGPNFIADQGRLNLYRDDHWLGELKPQKRRYWVQRNVMTEADILPGLFKDIYVSLGEPLADGAWAVRVHIKPLVRWLWLGALLMAAGGILALADRRYRIKSKTKMESQPKTEWVWS